MLNFRNRLEEEDPQFQLAPMIDIMFILVIFFLATAALTEMESEIDINLPVAQATEAPDHAPRDIIVNVRQDGLMVVNRRTLTSERLLDILQQIAEDNPNQGVIIRADAETRHKFVIHVMDLCKQAGIFNVTFPVIHSREGPETP